MELEKERKFVRLMALQGCLDPEDGDEVGDDYAHNGWG